MSDVVPIRPGVSILSVLSALPYKPWFAIAEFVDNAVQSYIDQKAEIAKIDGRVPRLLIEIRIEHGLDGQSLTIVDNAGGIAMRDFPRAFRPAEVPPDRSGLSEFGMGMKSAACWFSPLWEVQTSALSELCARTIVFDVTKIVNEQIEELEVQTCPAESSDHYTIIKMHHLHQKLSGSTVAKIKEHLRDIYRDLLRSDDVEIRFNGDPLKFEEPEFLNAPYFRSPDGESILWKKAFKIELGDSHWVEGYAGQLKTGSTSRAGFSLFRRKRVIQGSGDEGYRPKELFGSSNSYAFQRLYGELHFHGFAVTHTKDNLVWNGKEQGFLERLRAILSSAEFPLLSQIEGYRANIDNSRSKRAVMKALDGTVSDLESRGAETLSKIVQAEVQEDHEGGSDSLGRGARGGIAEEGDAQQSDGPMATRAFQMAVSDQTWTVVIELDATSDQSPWLDIVQSTDELRGSPGGLQRLINIRLSLEHPFMARFRRPDHKDLEPVLRIAAAMAVAEIAAKNRGIQFVGELRRSIDRILRNVMAVPEEGGGFE